jgi:hypothetical protein
LFCFMEVTCICRSPPQKSSSLLCFVFNSIFFFYRLFLSGSAKTQQKIFKKNNLTPSLFRTLTHPPTHHGGHRLFFGRPLVCLVLLIAFLGVRQPPKKVLTYLRHSPSPPRPPLSISKAGIDAAPRPL